MVDIKYIREHLEEVKRGVAAKGFKIDFEKIIKLDEERRKLQKEVDAMRARKNQASDKIPKASKDEKAKIIAEMKALDEQFKAREEALKNMTGQLDTLVGYLPNLAESDVKIGKDETENEILREVGKPTKFDFKAQDYLALTKEAGLIDIERAAKVSGSRFGYLKGKVALVELALINLVMGLLTDEKRIIRVIKKIGLAKELKTTPFVPVIPPVMVRPEMMIKSGHMMPGEEVERYFLKDDELLLVGTSEQSIVPMHMDEVLPLKNLPIRYVGFSTCFRREAGSYGKDTKGILRVHQFDKIEMVSFTTPETSAAEHELLLALEEEIMQELDLPYRVIKQCTGDLGASAAKKYDIEAWMPGQNQYRETHSTSNCTDYQTYKLNIKYQTAAGKNDFVHSLNGTAAAIGRMLIAILENGQQQDGSIVLPKKLQKYTGFSKI